MRMLKKIVTGLSLFYFAYSGIAFSQSNKLFLNAPEVIKLPLRSDKYDVKKRKFTGIPSLAVSKGGTIWTTWYAGITPDEDDNNYVVVASSKDGGESWVEKFIIDPDGDGPVRAFDPELWIDPSGKLWVFWAQSIGHDGTVAGVWSMTTENPDAENPVWSEPVRLTDGIMMCKPVVLSNGDWILPASTWRQTDFSAKVIVSKDKGINWFERGAVNVPKDVRSYDEHSIVEKKDGRLWMLVRTNYGIGESFSKDNGRSWSELVPSGIKHPSARFFITRLNSGNLLLVKHGPIDVKTERSHLMAFISKDDGESWSRGLLIDQRKGVSYPDGQQTKDGKIYIVYDYNRTADQNILFTTFTEDDIMASDYDRKIIKIFNSRKTVSKGGE